MRVFLITQRYLMLERDKGHVAGVVIQRLSEREWIPLFTLELEDGEEVKCSLRIMEREEVRTWADLNRLADWIRVRRITAGRSQAPSRSPLPGSRRRAALPYDASGPLLERGLMIGDLFFLT